MLFIGIRETLAHRRRRCPVRPRGAKSSVPPFLPLRHRRRPTQPTKPLTLLPSPRRCEASLPGQALLASPRRGEGKRAKSQKAPPSKGSPCRRRAKVCMLPICPWRIAKRCKPSVAPARLPQLERLVLALTSPSAWPAPGLAVGKRAKGRKDIDFTFFRIQNKRIFLYLKRRNGGPSI